MKSDVCGADYPSKAYIKKHRKAVHKESDFKVANYLSKNQAVHEESNFLCDHCERTFNRKDNLKRHLHGYHMRKKSAKSSVDSYKCGICKRTFNRKHNLTRHFQRCQVKKKLSEDSSIRSYKCDICNADYATKRYLNDHRKAIHEGSNFQCDNCNHIFNRKSNLIRHLATCNLRKKCTVDSSNGPYKCDVCESMFTFKNSMLRHKRSFHNKIGSSWTDVKFQCDICKHSFNRRDSLKRHYESCPWMENSIRQYVCEICNHAFTRKDNLRRHRETCILMKNSNCQYFNDFNCIECFEFFKNSQSIFKRLARLPPDIEIDHEHLEFSTMDDFYSWKENLEKLTFTSYRKGIVTKGKQYTVYKFICHRSGTYILKCHNRQRAEKLFGSKKVGACCPAEINVRLDNTIGSCKVFHMKNHLGHDISNKNEELRHIYVSKTNRDFLASKIALGIPHDRILDDNVESIKNYNVERLSLLSGKDLQSITQSSSEPNCSDQVCIDAFILLHSRSIIYCKKQNELDDKFPILSSEDVVIIIMTDSQKQFLQKYGENIVMVNGIHGVDEYNFLVLTLLVVDDDHEAIEVAIAITNRNDGMVASVFLDCIKNTVGCVNTRTLMTDTQDNYYTSWRNVMGEPQSRLFCPWHVREAWRRNLLKIANKEKRNSVRNQLYMISSRLDENVFLTELNEFLEDKDPDLKSFIQYFKTYYVENVTTWAHCYRKGARINTNMNVEAFHSALKKFIRKQNIRGRVPLYICLEVLNRFLQSQNKTLFQKEIKGKIPYKLRLLRTNHNLIERKEYLLRVDGNSSKGWYVSLTSDDIKEASVHFICLTGENCHECRLYCTKCEVCIHQFYCTCVDHAVRFNMCMHIHALCIFLQANNTNTEPPLNSPEIETSTYYLLDSLEQISMEPNETQSEDEASTEEIQELPVEEIKGYIKEKVTGICENLETVSDAAWLLETINEWHARHQK